MDLQPFHYPPFCGQSQQESGHQCDDRNPTYKFDYSTHNSANSKIPSNRNPANGCIKNWLSISESV